MAESGGKALLCRQPACRALVELDRGHFVVVSARATTQGIARVLELLIEKLKEQKATNLYEHLSKDDCKQIKAPMKDEWFNHPDTKDALQDLHAPTHPAQTLALTQGPITSLGDPSRNHVDPSTFARPNQTPSR